MNWRCGVEIEIVGPDDGNSIELGPVQIRILEYGAHSHPFQ